ncbi:protocatechuate 4,5-dioxygenase beta chain [Novosphingobium hassiacum]|uniref:Protocatechuate 4,5-dioxygenase beta chain n=1 Tax=Novosphingobium hassiacum TaxID=173676 RepID=A0A7W6A0L4_9SPHN|nr:protocatechuate 3,4-dioxygenase [Novosphingobium hassiacum]MBB3862332.1 protocatechuate 4,5-dioxygenase beta chain [Novosphingobium hassiacum]
MAQIVAGFTIPHIPLLAAKPEAPPADVRQKIWNAFDHVIDRLKQLQVDTIITIGDDHCWMFSPECVPQCLIAIGDVSGPREKWLGIEHVDLPVHEDLAMHILRAGQSMGMPWAFSKHMLADHATVIPYHFCYRHLQDAKIIPVYLNETIDPVISSALACRVGAALADAVSTWPGTERVAIVGTGGISHWVGMADMGETNEEFDRRILSLVASGDIDGLVKISDEDIVREGGNGALEVKSWICAMAALGSARGRLIAYEPVAEWITGIGFMELERAA